MPTIYVVRDPRDQELVEAQLLPNLPFNGYDHWIARSRDDDVRQSPLPAPLARAMSECEVVLVVVSPRLLHDMPVAEIDTALGVRRTVIVVRTSDLTDDDEVRIPAGLQSVPAVDLAARRRATAGRRIAKLLPPVDRDAGVAVPGTAKAIDWNTEVFTEELRTATKRHDNARASALVDALVAHLRRHPSPYPPRSAYEDLYLLRGERAFTLMSRYGQTVIGSGTRQDRVRRMLAQAQIEIRDYEAALDVLRSIVDDPESSLKEVFEARGLIGRVFKQQFVEAPDRSAAADLLVRAIASYESVYVEDPEQFWHGVNAASCMLRAERDHIAVHPPTRPREIATAIAGKLDDLAKSGPLTVWDCASRVEALLALGRYDDAQQAVDAYINHPSITAFEVWSTFRQFDQVLELGRRQPGEAVFDRLLDAVERHRATDLLADRASPSTEPSAVLSLVIRLGEPFDLDDVPGLVVGSRIGNVVTATGTEASVRTLLDDTRVVAVEKSRPTGSIECDRSVGFIHACREYKGPKEQYEETGDRALIAVIDDGVDVLHPAFLDADGHSRIVGIWHQSASSGEPPKGFTYGVYHDADDVASYVGTGQVPRELGRDDDGHGTHVASIAGGRQAAPFAGGVAPDAKLLIVIADAAGPIGYHRSHVDALAFIDAVATNRRLPVVVNVSKGMNAGAHDGKSTLEVAFDGFSQSGRKAGRVVVKSAGNERGKGGHAKVVIQPSSLERLRWNRLKGADYAERIELWWSSADELEFRLRDPEGNYSPWVGSLLPQFKEKRQNIGTVNLQFVKRHEDNGDSQLLIKLGDATGSAALGQWLLEIKGGAVPEGGVIHAWIERSQGVPTTFVDHNDEEMTLSIPGTASSVIVVGAVDASWPIDLGEFSSYGPTRDGQRKPLVCAPGMNVRAARGGAPADVLVDSGTSMAAPHVAGAIALLLSRAAKLSRPLNGNQITSALRQKTQNYSGNWNRGQGYGVVDVASLLAAFD
jgi:subtilisin family serine protease